MRQDRQARPPLTPATLRNQASRLDRLNAGAAAVLRAMRNGQALYLEFSPGPKWRLSNGRYVNDETARIVIASKHVTGVGDTLFRDGLSQTYRLIENRNQEGECQ
jgi:putative hemolysin